jgi:MFS family permease
MRGIKAFQSLKESTYRFFLGSQLCSSGAMDMRQVAQNLLLYRLTGSAALLGALALAQAIPMIALSPVAGAIADRVQKKHVVLLAVLPSTMLSLGVAFSLTVGYLAAGNAGSWWVLIAAAVLEGTVTSLSEPSRLAMIPDLVGHDRITNALALHQAGTTAARIMTPALAGFIIDAFGFEFAYYSRAALYLLSVVLWLFVPPVKKAMTKRGSILSDIKSVLLYLRQEPLITAILGFVLCVGFCSMPYVSLLSVFTEDILKVGATGLGVLQSVSGFGAIAAGLAIASLPNRRRGIMVIVTSIILGLALVGFSFSESWYLSLVLVTVIGIGQAGRMTLPMALIQNYTKDEYRGRVLSFYGIQVGMSNFGAFFAGILAVSIGVQWAVGGLAWILVILSLLALAFMPRLRKLD